jgi:hypothetical protein
LHVRKQCYYLPINGPNASGGRGFSISLVFIAHFEQMLEFRAKRADTIHAALGFFMDDAVSSQRVVHCNQCAG